MDSQEAQVDNHDSQTIDQNPSEAEPSRAETKHGGAQDNVPSLQDLREDMQDVKVSMQDVPVNRADVHVSETVLQLSDQSSFEMESTSAENVGDPVKVMSKDVLLSKQDVQVDSQEARVDDHDSQTIDQDSSEVFNTEFISEDHKKVVEHANVMAVKSNSNVTDEMAVKSNSNATKSFIDEGENEMNVSPKVTSASDFWSVITGSKASSVTSDTAISKRFDESVCKNGKQQILETMTESCTLIRSRMAQVTLLQQRWDVARSKLAMYDGFVAKRGSRTVDSDEVALMWESEVVKSILIGPYQESDDGGNYMKVCCQAFSLSEQLKKLHHYEQSAELSACAHAAVLRCKRSKERQVEIDGELHWHTTSTAAHTYAERSHRTKEALRKRATESGREAATMLAKQVTPSVCIVCNWGLTAGDVTCDRCGKTQGDGIQQEDFKSVQDTCKVTTKPQSAPKPENDQSTNNSTTVRAFLEVPSGGGVQLDQELSDIVSILRAAGQHEEANTIMEQFSNYMTL